MASSAPSTDCRTSIDRFSPRLCASARVLVRIIPDLAPAALEAQRRGGRSFSSSTSFPVHREEPRFRTGESAPSVPTESCGQRLDGFLRAFAPLRETYSVSAEPDLAPASLEAQGRRGQSFFLSTPLPVHREEPRFRTGESAPSVPTESCGQRLDGFLRAFAPLRETSSGSVKDSRPRRDPMRRCRAVYPLPAVFAAGYTAA
jgi:hypothetical protein